MCIRGVDPQLSLCLQYVPRPHGCVLDGPVHNMRMHVTQSYSQYQIECTTCLLKGGCLRFCAHSISILICVKVVWQEHLTLPYGTHTVKGMDAGQHVLAS
jgi:L-lactate utilization protein LutB